MSSLALHGGNPVRENPFPEWPCYDEREEKALLRVLNSGRWFAGFLGGAEGTEVEGLEQEFAENHNTAEAVAVANGTAALELSLRSLGIGAGDEVIVPTWTFISTASAVLQNDAIPRIVDIEPKHCCIDPVEVEDAINEHTRAIIPVFYGGQIANMDELTQLAEANNLAVVVDACHAHGSVRNGKTSGEFGDMSCFSFQESKTMTAGEGGIITTNDHELAEAARSYRSNGRERGQPGYEHHRLGWNYRMSEFHAALLRVQLQRLDNQVQTRTENARYLTKNFQEISGFLPISEPDGTDRNGHYLYSIRIDSNQFPGIDNQTIEEAIQAEGIPCGTLYMPIHRSPLFQSETWEQGGMSFFSRYLDRDLDFSEVDTPVADQAFDEIVEVRQHVLLGDQEDMDDVLQVFQKVSRELGEKV